MKRNPLSKTISQHSLQTSRAINIRDLQNVQQKTISTSNSKPNIRSNFVINTLQKVPNPNKLTQSSKSTSRIGYPKGNPQLQKVLHPTLFMTTLDERLAQNLNSQTKGAHLTTDRSRQQGTRPVHTKDALGFVSRNLQNWKQNIKKK